MNRRHFLSAAALACLSGNHGRIFAQTRTASGSNWNLKAPTLGGTQLWADVWFFHQFRIQRNVLTDHHRLLDPHDVRLAWGSLESCQAALQALREEKSLPPMSGQGVVVLHGLLRSRNSMNSLCEHLRKAGGYSVFDVGYPTTRGSVDDHAGSLDSVMQSLADLDEVSFVAHSLGNIVIRYWLHEVAPNPPRPSALPAFGRMVMLAPPNHQPAMAVALIRGELMETLAGQSAVELADGWQELEPKLNVPPFGFGILAGGRGNDSGYNLLLDGDDDGVITVENTRLAGAADFRRINAMHSFIMSSAQARRMTLRFLKDGSFEGQRKRQPIDSVTTAP